MKPWGLWLTLSVVSVASAQTVGGDAKSRALYREAQQSYDRGELEPALKLFLQAYDARPLPGFLFNIAQCHRQLGNWERAGFYFKRYLELAPNTPNAAVVRDLIVEVDEKRAKEEQQRNDVLAANRAKDVELARAAAAQAEADAAKHRQSELEAERQLELAASAREAEEAAQRALTMPPPPEAAPTPSILTRWYLWAGVGVVVAGAAGAAVYVATTPSPRPTTFGTDSAR